MARITVEDCVKKTDRFSLIIAAAQRVREIEGGAPLTVARENDKFPVVALREIAEGKIEPQRLEDSVLKSLKKQRVRGDFEENFEEAVLDDDPLIADVLEADLSDASEDDALFPGEGDGDVDDTYAGGESVVE
ncbi:MAG: DNA-directed RNA polymerase subunit omega [Holosporales bacterium]|nr:DNA-directed RNA polymerase subunit omega [Holosporales bacterium]